MKRLPIAIPVLLIVLAAGNRAAAQPYQSTYTPAYNYYAPGSALSPWLNLTRNNFSPAVNYYLGVLPEQERRYDVRRFQNALLGEQRATERDMQELQRSLLETVPGYNPLSPTGTYSPYDFKNQYFPSSRRGR